MLNGVWGTCNFALDFMIVQDFSNSFADDVEQMETLLPTLLSDILATYPGSRFGLTSFTDKPLPPFGHPAEEDWFRGDYCYDVLVPLDTNNADAIVDALSSASTPDGGYDWPENQLGALHDLALNASLSGWGGTTINGNVPLIKVLLLSSDSPYHEAPEGLESVYQLTPNDGDGYTDCQTEDYPSVKQVASALKSRSIFPIFLAGESQRFNTNEIYSNLLNEMDMPGHVYSLKSDSSDIMEGVAEALDTLSGVTCGMQTVDVVFTQDVTYSYNNDVDNLHNRLQTVMSGLQQNYIAPRFGLTTFGDKPLEPLGHAGSGDYCYKLESALTPDASKIVEAAREVNMVSGWDWRESQLDAIISTVHDPNINWRQGEMWNGFELLRILVVATDAGYHRAPDAADHGHALLPRRDNGVVNCLGEEYPSWRQVGKVLADAGVHPIFVPTSDIVSIYNKLLTDLENEFNVVGAVVELNDFDNLPRAVTEGLVVIQGQLGGVQPEQLLP